MPSVYIIFIYMFFLGLLLKNTMDLFPLLKAVELSDELSVEVTVNSSFRTRFTMIRSNYQFTLGKFRPSIYSWLCLVLQRSAQWTSGKWTLDLRCWNIFLRVTCMSQKNIRIPKQYCFCRSLCSSDFLPVYFVPRYICNKFTSK